MSEVPGDGGEGGDAGGPMLRRGAYRDLKDEALMDAMRRRDERAIEEFIVRHQRLLGDRARRWRVAHCDVEACLGDVIEDIAVSIVNDRIRPARSLAAYVAKSFRSRLVQMAKANRRATLGFEYASARDAAGERTVPSVVSENTLHASQGADWQPVPTTPAVARLAELLDKGLNDQERRILDWLSHHVPQRDICAWLGVSYAAGTQRIWRLRARLRAAARSHAATFSLAERAQLARLFGRAEGLGRHTRTKGANDEGR